MSEDEVDTGQGKDQDEGEPPPEFPRAPSHPHPEQLPDSSQDPPQDTLKDLLHDQLGVAGSVVTVIHFTYQMYGKWHIACMPHMAEFHRTPHHKNYLRSDDVRACTCQACARTGIFKQTQDRLVAATSARSRRPGSG